MPFFRDLGSRRSPTACSAGRSAILSVRLVGRTSKRTSAPFASSCRATWLPKNPVAPVTKLFIEVGRLSATASQYEQLSLCVDIRRGGVRHHPCRGRFPAVLVGATGFGSAK